MIQCIYSIYIYSIVYIYGTPPWDLPQSILIYCLYMYIYIYIYVHIYKSQLFFKDVLWVVAVHTIKTSWKQKKNNIWRLFWRESMGKTQKNKKPRENQQKTIFGDSLGKLYWQNQKNLEKTKKPKNQNFSENVWSEAHVWFFLFCLGFFVVFFGLDLEKTKKTQGFFCFLDNMMVKELWKTKKTQVFFGFWVFVALVSFWLRNEKQKKPWVFLVFHTSLTIILSKKPKTPWVFLVFSRSRPKKPKKPRQNQKKPNMSLRPNILWKVLVFWFSRGFGYSVFPKIQPKSRKL